MKAFALITAGEPAALVDLPEPDVAADGALVHVRTASVNGFDIHQASGALLGMIPHDLPTVIGRDFAGTVLAVGNERTDVAVGDEVLGFTATVPPLRSGAWAEILAGS